MAVQKLTFKSFEWINLVEPTEEEVRQIGKQYNFHHLAIDDCLSNRQQPKIDDYEAYLFMVFHLPRFVKKVGRTIALELDVFLNNNFIITIHNGKLKPLNLLFSEYSAKNPEELRDNPAYLLYDILKLSFNYCFPMLEKLGTKLDLLEDKLYEDQSQRNLEEISVIAQDIISFRRIIGPQRYFIKDLEAAKTKVITENLEIYFDDIEDNIDRIWDTLTNYKEVCEVMQRTTESILTQRLNEVMKFLTIISVIMLPLTVITGFYGMNIVGLPLAENNYASEIIIGILLLVIVSMLYYFKRKDWL